MEEKISDRLKSFINYLQITDSEFADRCGISRSTLSLFLSGKNKTINDNTLSQIHAAFPELSIIWLLFGNGEMCNSDNTLRENVNNISSNNFYENSIFAEEFESNPKYKNLETSSPGELHSNKINCDYDQIKKIVEAAIDFKLHSIIEKKEKRKIERITVYYTDNTFESFYTNE